MPRASSRPVLPFAVLLPAALLLTTACAPRAPRSAWKVVEIPTDADFPGVWFSDSLNGWLTGGGWDIEGGIVGRTRDGGRTWTFESGVIGPAGRGHGLGHVQFRDSLRGWAAGPNGHVVLTDDGGRMWRPARSSGTSSGLFDLQFLDGSRGWASGSGAIVRTEDGGETWRRVVRNEAENGYLSANAIHFIDESRGWLVSHGGQLKHTEDGGREWSPVALPLRPKERPTLRDVTFLDAQRGWIVGEEGSIFHTADGGATWVMQENGVPVVRAIPKGEERPREVMPELEMPPDRLALTQVKFADANRGWAVGYYADVAESVVLGTRDGGATWAVEHVQRGELLRGLFVADSTHVWASGDRARTTPQVVLRYAPGEK